ncbi:MAG: tRNA 2-thiouridine(34) synthase MnmA [Dehalococcoidia bacterium]|nr:MAG: tRNA 2-thiouridine(34) synthase MnmA [Dehalococcoidia bacterium]
MAKDPVCAPGEKKVVVAMSGGVDSSVAAAILKEEGYQVIGITMQVWPPDKGAAFGGCCGVDAIEDAKKVAYNLGIPHYVLDFRDIFAEKVIADFCRQYSLGRTPNPCIRCNQYLKFDVLLKRAGGLGADFVASGHYARVEKDGSRYLLKKGVDRNKDQSYFLYTLTQPQLEHTLMPLGSLTKGEVRGIASKLGLPVATKVESQEICFIPDDNYADFVRECLPRSVKSGPVLNRRGEVLGEHRGIPFYTVGQRKGLGIAAREPLYVTAIVPGRNAIVVGSKDEVYHKELIAGELNWISQGSLSEPIAARAKIRYRHQEAAAEIIPLEGGRVGARFKEPQMAITPGQAVVFYLGDSVLGGGTIEKWA